MQIAYLEAGKYTQNKHGSFAHDEMLEAPYGTKIYSRDRKGFIMMLRPTPELWTDSLPHRTQIIYNTDISNILLRLELVPGCIAVESGTGSGSMTHSMARAVGPTGHVYSFDYHELRVQTAAVEFKRHGMSQVTVAQADVCNVGFPVPEGVFADGVLLGCVCFAARTHARTHTCTRACSWRQTLLCTVCLHKEQGSTRMLSGAHAYFHARVHRTGLSSSPKIWIWRSKRA